MKNGTSFPFIKPLCDEPSGAVISYVPLPYTKRLKITVSPGQKNDYYYYQINYTALPAHTPVVSFSLPLNNRQMQQLTETCGIWEHPETLYTIGTKDAAAVSVPAGEETVLFSSKESGLIKEWALSVNNGHGDLPVQLPSRLVLKMYWNGFHLDAPIRFKKQFTASFEFGDGNTSSGYFAGTAYWYQANPAAVPNLPPVTARQRPKDPLEQQAFMCEIFETERRQNSQEAIALCREYAGTYPGTPDAAMFLLRAQAYQAYLHTEQAEQLIGPGATPECQKQAALLRQFYADPEAALISAHVNGIYTLYLDGTLLLQGNNMTMQQTALTALPPGSHTLTMRVQWTKPDNWINVHLRTHTTNLWSGTDWECAQQPDATDWKPCIHRGFLPKMSWIRFEPNAMVYTQQHPLTGPQPGWDEPGKICYFRKTFEIQGTEENEQLSEKQL